MHGPVDAAREAGSAVVTHPGDLQVRRIIHAVGPIWGGHGGSEDAEDCRSIAFPAISCGVYKFPVERAARIALRTILAFLEGDSAIELVRYCLFSEEDYLVFARALRELVGGRADGAAE